MAAASNCLDGRLNLRLDVMVWLEQHHADRNPDFLSVQSHLQISIEGESAQSCHQIRKGGGCGPPFPWSIPQAPMIEFFHSMQFFYSSDRLKPPRCHKPIKPIDKYNYKIVIISASRVEIQRNHSICLEIHQCFQFSMLSFPAYSLCLWPWVLLSYSWIARRGSHPLTELGLLF